MSHHIIVPLERQRLSSSRELRLLSMYVPRRLIPYDLYDMGLCKRKHVGTRRNSQRYSEKRPIKQWKIIKTGRLSVLKMSTWDNICLLYTSCYD